MVGAGFTGLSCALAGAQRGIDCVVLEAAEIGWGASGRNNGLVIPNLTRADPDKLVQTFGQAHGESLGRLLAGSADTVFELIRQHQIDCEAAQTGWIQPAHRPSRMALARSRHDQWRRLGARVAMLDRERVAELTGSDLWFGGWIAHSGGHLNPLGFSRGLARAAIDAGARLFTRSPVRALRREGDRWLADTGAGRVRARKVILATQAYSGFHAQPWPGLARAMLPVRSYQMATEPIPEVRRAHILPGNPAVSDTHNDLHFAHFDHAGRLITGGALVIGAGYEHRLRVRIGRRLQRIFPALRDAPPPRFETVWHGYLSITPDRMPRFYRLADGLVTWIGCNGRAVAFATALGPRLVDAAMDTVRPGEALPFEPMRTVPAHALVRQLSPMMLNWYRWLDRRD